MQCLREEWQIWHRSLFWLPLSVSRLFISFFESHENTIVEFIFCSLSKWVCKKYIHLLYSPIHSSGRLPNPEMWKRSIYWFLLCIWDMKYNLYKQFPTEWKIHKTKNIFNFMLEVRLSLGWWSRSWSAWSFFFIYISTVKHLWASLYSTSSLDLVMFTYFAPKFSSIAKTFFLHC